AGRGGLAGDQRDQPAARSPEAGGGGGGMTAAELRGLVAELAADEALWRPHVHHVADRRTYELLLHDEDVMAWVISWMDDHDTGFHDHDVSSGAVHVVEGRIREERLRL